MVGRSNWQLSFDYNSSLSGVEIGDGRSGKRDAKIQWRSGSSVFNESRRTTAVYQQPLSRAAGVEQLITTLK